MTAKTPGVTLPRLSSKFASEDLFSKASDLIKKEKLAKVRNASGDVDMPQEHHEADVVAKRAVLIGIEIDLVTAFLLVTNPIELRMKLWTTRRLSGGRST